MRGSVKVRSAVSLLIPAPLIPVLLLAGTAVGQAVPLR